MTPERWRKLNDLFHRALEMDEPGRAAFLGEHCIGDDTLRQDVERLLENHSAAQSALKTGVVQEAVHHLAGNVIRPPEIPLRRIGRYQVIRELGRGAMGVVYRCADPNIRREVAVKVVRLVGGENTEILSRRRDRLFREARSAGALNHPNIVAVYDIGEEENVAYIAMELVEGTTLHAMLQEGEPLPVPRVMRLLTETAEALDYAHRKGTVHCDIKPANIMVNESGRVRITDFGIAKPSATELMTQTGTIMGTPDYMSPEHMLGKPVTGAADRYSLAVIAYEMLTGKRPFVADQLPSLVYQIVYENPPPLRNLNPKLGEAIDGVMRQGLAKAPEERHRSCLAFVEALQAACNPDEGRRRVPPGGPDQLASVPQAIRRPPQQHIVLSPPGKAEADDPAGAKRKPRSLRPVHAALILVACGAMAGFWFSKRQTMTVAKVDLAEATPVAKPTARRPEPAQSAAKIKIEAPKPPPLQAREIVVRTDPPGARLVMDGNPESACTTPCMVHADAGPHSITVKSDGFALVRRAFYVSDEPVDLGVIALTKATGVIYLASEPAGAAVIIDEKPWLEVTPVQLTLPVGTYKITLRLDGVEASHDVQVNESEIKHLSLKLPR